MVPSHSITAEEWPQINRERGSLIDKGISGSLTADEAERLEYLQASADLYLERRFPRPPLPEIPDAAS
jgi:hypothetical protein